MAVGRDRGAVRDLRRAEMVWVLADRADALARLLEAVTRAGMIPCVMAVAQRPASGAQVAPVAVLLDAAALGEPVRHHLDVLRQATRSPILIVADERAIPWLIFGATAVLPAGVGSTAIALQLRSLHTLAPAPTAAEVRCYGPFVHDPGRATIAIAGSTVRCSLPLTTLLLCLLRAEGGVVRSEQVLRDLQRSGVCGGGDVRSHVRRLRACLEQTLPGLGSSVVTVRGVGYRADLERAARASAHCPAARAPDAASPRAESGNEH